MAKFKSVITAYQTQQNTQIQGTLNITGVFDNIIQPMFPYPMLTFSIIITFEEMDKASNFELRLNSPDDDLITKESVRVNRDPFGIGKTVINLEKFLITKRGKYTMDIFEKVEDKFIFIKTIDLFIADFPPQRRISEEDKERILADESLIKTIKITFTPFGAKREISVQINLDKNTPIEVGYLAIPENDILIIDGIEYDMTGVRRQFEWMFGGPVTKKEPEKKSEN
jgi:hypothetical protein